MGLLPGRLPVSGATVATTVVPRARRRSAEARRKAFLITVANHSVAIALTAAFVLPLFFVVTTSLMTQQQALTHDLIPHPFQWRNYVDIFKQEPILRYGWNTFVYAGLATVGVVVSSVPVAYALSVIKWRGPRAVFLLVISTMMLPSQVTIVPLFLFFRHLGWIGSLKPLIVPAIPGDLVDAARVDGANEFQIMWHVVVKIAKPAIAAVGLFQFLY